MKKSLLEASGGERCCIIGTVFKKMELKPTILKEISTNVIFPPQNVFFFIFFSFGFVVIFQHHLLPQPPRAKFISSSDLLVIEDSTQRMYLCGNIPSQELVTGKPLSLSLTHSLSFSLSLSHTHTLSLSRCYSRSIG